MNYARSIVLSLLLASAAPAQTGVLDQDNTANDNVTWAMAYFNDHQQEVAVGVAGQLEGFLLRMWVQNTGSGLPVAIFLGPGPHAAGAVPAWSGTAYAASAGGYRDVFVDVSAASLFFQAGNVFTIRCGDAVGFSQGVDLKGNSGWPNPYYAPAFYESGRQRTTDRLWFRTFVFACPSGSFGRYGAGCAGSGGFAPSLDLVGCPQGGNRIDLVLSGGLGGSPALLVFGLGQSSIPIGGGCSLLVGPLVNPQLGLVLAGSQPGAGGVSVPALVPFGVGGQSIAVQGFVLDGGAVLGVTLSNGVVMRFG